MCHWWWGVPTRIPEKPLDTYTVQLKTNKYLQIDELKTEKGVHLMMGTKSIKLCSNLLPLIFETYSDPFRDVWWALYHYTTESVCSLVNSINCIRFFKRLFYTCISRTDFLPCNWMLRLLLNYYTVPIYWLKQCLASVCLERLAFKKRKKTNLPVILIFLHVLEELFAMWTLTPISSPW